MLGRTSDEIDDLFTSIIPRLTLRYETERSRLEASGGLDTRLYSDLSDLNALNRDIEYDAAFRVTPRLSVFSAGEYRVLEDTDEVEEGGRTLSLGRPDFQTTFARGGVRYALTRRSGVTLSGLFADFDFGRGDTGASQQRDSHRSSYSLALDRVLSARDTVRLTLTRADGAFDSTRFSPSSESSSHSLDLLWGRSWNSRWTSSFSAGVQRLESDVVDAQIVPLVPGDLPDSSPDDTTTSFVGSASLQRRSKRAALAFRYSREIRPSSGFGTDLTIDSLAASFERRLSRRWSLRLVGNWTLLRSATEQVFAIPAAPAFCVLFPGTVPAVQSGVLPVCAGVSDSAIDSQTRSLSVVLSWRTSERWSTFLRYRFRDQVNDGDNLTLEDFDKHMVSLGFRYRYDLDLL